MCMFHANVINLQTRNAYPAPDLVFKPDRMLRANRQAAPTAKTEMIG